FALLAEEVGDVIVLVVIILRRENACHHRGVRLDGEFERVLSAGPQHFGVGQLLLGHSRSYSSIVSMLDLPLPTPRSPRAGRPGRWWQRGIAACRDSRDRFVPTGRR